ncbi:hypothetical protein KC959_01510 [Candidatus Saccharibacteria bacterium]|nr:hypothetical protein [Candidatus Saccharibacteria bacterium]
MHELHADMPYPTGEERAHNRKPSEIRARSESVLRNMDAKGTSSPEARSRGRLLLPAAAAVLTLMSVPEVRTSVVDAVKGIGHKVENNYDMHNGPDTTTDQDGQPVIIAQSPDQNGQKPTPTEP